jgi:hypothetical protein
MPTETLEGNRILPESSVKDDGMAELAGDFT